MSSQSEKILKKRHLYLPFLERLRHIYAAMDEKYDEAAAYYRFRCTGCEDNCCRTRFYHYTCAEYLYLLEGVSSLSPEKRIKIESRASRVFAKTETDRLKHPRTPPMCPLNLSRRCALYAHRPMICRLHGIPHEIHRPGMPVSYGTGCDLFEQEFGRKDHFRFDRTPFYIQTAGLEGELRRILGVSEKIKFSIARMLVKLS